MSNEQQRAAMDFPEQQKFGAEYMRHFTTLSTGALVVTAAFSEKIFQRPIAKPLLAMAVAGFLFSIIGALVTYTMMLVGLRRGVRVWEFKAATAGVFVTWAG